VLGFESRKVKELAAIEVLRRGAMYIGASSLFLNVLALALPLALLQIYDRIIPNNATSTLFLLISGVVVAVFLEMVLRIARADIVGWSGAQFEHEAGCRAFRHLLDTPADELEKLGPGDLMERIGGLPTVREVFSENWTLVVCDLPFVLLFLGCIAYVGGLLVLAPIVVLAVFVYMTVSRSKRTEAAITDFNKVRDQRQNFSIEIVQGVHTVKSMSMEAQMIQRYARLQETVGRHLHHLNRENAGSMALSTSFSQLLTLSIVVCGGYMVVDGRLSVGGLAACTLLAGRALQPIQKAVALWTRWQTANLLQERFSTIFSLPQEPKSENPIIQPVFGEVELKNVSVRIGGEGPMLFDDLNLHVKAGERVALVGDNGTGKSTLLRLIYGSQGTKQGLVLLDGSPIENHHRSNLLLKNGIAFVPQRGELVRGTILENMTMFRSERRREALRIAKALGLDTVIYRLAKGYHTRVGDSGSDVLPRGVVQRIAVVRALVTHPRVLLFDDANASMDGPGDESLRQYFDNMSRDTTLIMVTLRPSMQRMADRVLRIEGGKLVEAKPPSAPPIVSSDDKKKASGSPAAE